MIFLYFKIKIRDILIYSKRILIKPLPKKILFIKILNKIFLLSNLFNSSLFDKFQKENDVEGFITRDNIDKLINEVKDYEQITDFYKKEGFTVYDNNWNAYNALYDFLEKEQLLPFSKNLNEIKKNIEENISFYTLFILNNSKAIFELLLKEFENDFITFEEFDNSFSEMLNDEIKNYSYLGMFITHIILETYNFIINLGEKLFNIDYFINYKEKEYEKKEILENSKIFVYNRIYEENKELNQIIEHCEKAFDIKDMKERFFKELDKNLENINDEAFNKLNTIIKELASFQEIIMYDEVSINKDGKKYLKNLTSLFIYYIFFNMLINLLKKVYDKKVSRIKGKIEKYNKKTESNHLDYLYRLLGKKRNIMFIIKFYYMQNYEPTDKMKNNSHRYLLVNIKSFAKFNLEVSNDIAFYEKISHFIVNSTSS